MMEKQLDEQIMEAWKRVQGTFAPHFRNKRIENPIGSENLLFRRTTNRYAQKGTISANHGYLKVSRDAKTGKFISRTT